MIIKCTHCKAQMKVADAAFANGIPTVSCPICKQKFKPDVPEPPKPATGASGPEVGWLVVHDENTHQQTYPIHAGKQVVGRKSESRPCDIMIETGDEYMSRQHFTIEAVQQPSGSYNYFLADSQSTNKTFINTRTLREVKRDDEYMLQDGDTIQAGRTKIVFKSNKMVKTGREATRLVMEQPKGKTVVV